MEMQTKKPEPIGKVMAMMALFVVLGTPMVGYLWEVLNEVLALEASQTQILVAIPVLAVFLVLLGFMARALRGV